MFSGTQLCFPTPSSLASGLLSPWSQDVPASYLHWSKKMKARLPWWSSGEESSCQCREHRLDPWSRKIPCAAAQQSPCSTARETTTRRALSSIVKSSPHSLQLGESTRSSEDPAQPKIKFEKKRVKATLSWLETIRNQVSPETLSRPQPPSPL